MKYSVFVVSDGTGRTAQQALDAALTQFSNIDTDVKVRSGLRTEEEVDQILNEVVCAKAFILHTIVQDKVRHYLIRVARQRNIETIDLMGPLLSRLGIQFENHPSQKPGLFHNQKKEYFKRIDSMQFAFAHDDGLRSHELDKAEIILIGVSRTFKTPLSIYFAYKGWFVANIPIVPGIEPPQTLFKVNPQKVFCLTNTARRLSTLRSVREEHLGKLTGNYASLPHVRKELLYADSIYNRQSLWPIIKVSGKSIEEIASEILSIRATYSSV